MKPVNSYIGTPVVRVEDARFLTGCGEYVGDIARVGLLHAVILRSPIAHGRILAIDTAPARAISGCRKPRDLRPSRSAARTEALPHEIEPDHDQPRAQHQPARPDHAEIIEVERSPEHTERRDVEHDADADRLGDKDECSNDSSKRQ